MSIEINAIIAIFKIKAHTRKNETNPGNRKQLLHEKHPE